MMERRDRLELDERDLAVARWGIGDTHIVMLHDGLGSIGQWRDVPARIAEATGLGVLAYERAGHGSSRPIPVGAWPADWLHREAEVLDALLAAEGVDAPLLVGHSDGGSIALIHAASGRGAAGLVALAPHSWVESICSDAIRAIRNDPGQLVERLGRFHDEPAAVFEAWSGVWVSDPFSRWDIRPSLSLIDVPVAVVQGDGDQYATAAQLVETVRAIGANATGHQPEGVGHEIHRDDPDFVVGLVAELAAAVLP